MISKYYLDEVAEMVAEYWQEEVAGKNWETMSKRLRLEAQKQDDYAKTPDLRGHCSIRGRINNILPKRHDQREGPTL